jgi:hypothetical protein
MDLYCKNIYIPIGASDLSLVQLVQTISGPTHLLIQWARETHFVAGYFCWDLHLTTHLHLPSLRMSVAMSHSTHISASRAQGQLSFHSYKAVASKRRRHCNCYCYWRQEIWFARLQLSGGVCPAALVDIWIGCKSQPFQDLYWNCVLLRCIITNSKTEDL